MTWRRWAGGRGRARAGGGLSGAGLPAGTAGSFGSFSALLARPLPQANAPSCDRLEDLASLVYLNESSVVHTLRQRYGASLLHTYAGPSLLVLSPRGAPALYSEKVGRPPHPRAASWTYPATPYPAFPGSAPAPRHPTGLLSALAADLGKRCHVKGWRTESPSLPSPQPLTEARRW